MDLPCLGARSGPELVDEVDKVFEFDLAGRVDRDGLEGFADLVVGVLAGGRFGLGVGGEGGQDGRLGQAAGRVEVDLAADGCGSLSAFELLRVFGVLCPGAAAVLRGRGLPRPKNEKRRPARRRPPAGPGVQAPGGGSDRSCHLRSLFAASFRPCRCIKARSRRVGEAGEMTQAVAGSPSRRPPRPEWPDGGSRTALRLCRMLLFRLRAQKSPVERVGARWGLGGEARRGGVD